MINGDTTTFYFDYTIIQLINLDYYVVYYTETETVPSRLI